MKDWWWQECRTEHAGVFRFAVLITLLSILTSPRVGSGAVYRCTDEAGGIMFQQIPCADGSEVHLDVPVTEWVAAPRSNREKRSGHSGKSGSQAALSRAARAEERQHKACWRAEQRIERIEGTLRRGYSPAQGERLRRQRREQQDYLRTFCR
ncbi:MAG: DUF4124 domain-containing protein [Sedimenticola sp.]|nr:DUF4124 domain-containing protein [Sedimenticola sp.]